MIVSIRWVDSKGNTAGNINHFIDYGQWSQLVQQSNNKQGRLTINLSTNKIETRYLIIECNFTLRPLNGAKIEIQNLPDKEIVPLVYGNYTGQQNPI